MSPGPDLLPAAGDSAGSMHFWQNTLDALEDTVAVIGDRGEIVAVNLRWRQFGAENGLGGVGDVGDSYLGACQSAAVDDPAVALLSSGIVAVLEGRAERFDGGYPCHSPTERRWYTVTVVPLWEPDWPARAMISHRNVTAAQEALQVSDAIAVELQRTHDFLQTVTGTMPGGLFVLGDDGCVSYMNHGAETLLGWTFDDVAFRRIYSLWGAEGDDQVGGSQLAAAIARARTGGVPVRVSDDVFRQRDGSDLPVAYSVASTTLPTGATGMIVVFIDNTAGHEEARRLRRESDTLHQIAAIKDALADERFVMFAQPIVDLHTDETIQHELLIRMVDHDGAIVAPGEFLPIAEEYGLIKEIDRYVIERAMRFAAAGHSVALNVSAHSLSDSQLGEFVEERLNHHEVDPSLIGFEITETALVTNEETANAFVTLVNSLGCTIALDDFGTGYGSFHYLKHLPVHMLKIDREFVRDLHSDQTSKLVVEAVVSLAQGLGKITVAEGIEDAETLETLRGLGVDHAQGFFLGRPAPASAVFGVPR